MPLRRRKRNWLAKSVIAKYLFQKDPAGNRVQNPGGSFHAGALCGHGERGRNGVTRAYSRKRANFRRSQGLMIPATLLSNPNFGLMRRNGLISLLIVIVVVLLVLYLLGLI